MNVYKVAPDSAMVQSTPMNSDLHANCSEASRRLRSAVRTPQPCYLQPERSNADMGRSPEGIYRAEAMLNSSLEDIEFELAVESRPNSDMLDK